MSGVGTGRSLLAVVMAATLLVAPVAAGSDAISMSADAPGAAERGDTFEVTFTIENEASQPTDALGFKLSALPEGFEPVSYDTDGSVAENRQAVFWTDPVGPGDSVQVTVVVRVADDAPGGTTKIRAVASTNQTQVRSSSVVELSTRATQTTTAQPKTTTKSPMQTATETTSAVADPTTEPETERELPSGTGIPGFGPAVTLVALVAATLVASRRR